MDFGNELAPLDTSKYSCMTAEEMEVALPAEKELPSTETTVA